MKKFLSISFLLVLFSPLSFSFAACPPALPDSNPNFCASFKTSAICHCPLNTCPDMNVVYARMISIFGTILKACQFQHETSVQICVDDWSCYRKGGRDSNGNLCSGTGAICPP